mmetsp:Transcript_42091/g.136197  ORF Transcript_42091/g.136197 Transcript_42091/m.136197 type:complete len:530 (+) Transcript_42091:1528-3117(+)
MTAISGASLRRLSEEFTVQNLSNIAWAFATLGVRDEPLFDAIAAAAIRPMCELGDRDIAAFAWSFAAISLTNAPLIESISSSARPCLSSQHVATRSLANIAWAFANWSVGDKPLLHAIAEQAVAKISEDIRCQTATASSVATFASLADVITNLNAIAWALNFMGFLTDELDRAMYSLVATAAEMRDRLMKHDLTAPLLALRLVSRPEASTIPGPLVSTPTPRIVVDLPEMCVVHKPPDWEVDCVDVGSGFLLSTYLQCRFSLSEAPLVHLEEHQFGMVHRLDRVSSGLLLVGKTFVGFNCAKWQLNTGQLQREYVVLVHGWVPLDLRFIDAKVLHVHAQGGKESSVTEQGKPSQTRLTTLGHYTLQRHSSSRVGGDEAEERVEEFQDDEHGEVESFSLVVIQICTGRRHQIRTHLAHVGYPTVTDGKYATTKAQFVRDKRWCPRNFLHRYRLGFCDSRSVPHEAVAPLPEDLASAATQLRPRESASGCALAEWLLGQMQPRPWATYRPLALAPSVEGLPASRSSDLAGS